MRLGDGSPSRPVALTALAAIIASLLVGTPAVAAAPEPAPTESAAPAGDQPAAEEAQPAPEEAEPLPEEEVAPAAEEAEPLPEEEAAPQDDAAASDAVITPLSVSPGNSTIRTDNIFYAYVAAGENLDVSFVKVGAGGGADVAITVRGPGGVTDSCTRTTADPGGATCDWADLTATSSGIWEITFDVLTASNLITADRYDWSIDVQSGTTTLPGRVYTERYGMAQASTQTTDVTLWYQSEQGYQYRADYTAYNGIDSNFSSNATGVAQLNTCVSAYESMDSAGPYSDAGRLWTPPPGECGDPYKIFFEAPSASLPATATLWNGTTEWIRPPVVLPTLAGLSFARDATTTSAGAFTLDVSDFTGQLTVLVDVNNDGDYTDPVDRSLPAAVTADGAASVDFDGLDGQGDPIAPTQAFGARVAITQAGEIHFVNFDVEARGGLRVEALNGPESGSTTLYWNDTALRTEQRICLTPETDGRAGVASDAGVHGWPCDLTQVPSAEYNANNGIGGSWGDVRNIDDWTYHQIDEFEEIEVAAIPFDLGDAPDSYATELAADGPRHAVVDGVRLGADIDDEADGQPNAAADGDGADDDGVIFNPDLGYATPTIRTGVDPQSQQPIENTLEVEASADGFVSVWVDWNQDGDFADAGEQVANAQAVTAGDNDVTFSQGTNPAAIQSYVRVRYSTDAASIGSPTGASPDGEIEDYRVLFERLIQPDTCTVTGAAYYAFTFAQPAAGDLTGTGGVGSTARYRDVTVVEGVAVDMFVEVIAGDMREAGSGGAPPNGFHTFGDDAAWQIDPAATLRYSFYEAGTTTPVDINGVFTVDDLDSPETATFSAADLAGYAVTQGSTVVVTESGGDVVFDGTSDGNATMQQRFQVVFEGISSFQARWQGFVGSGFGFDGDGDNGIQAPACQDFGDAPDGYGTTIGASGANHTIVAGLLIGSEIDFDPEGQPTPGADGDDSNRAADEDGVADPIVVTVGDETTVTVTATNSTASDATLAGWIDLDGSGAFDAGELVTVAVPAGSGTAAYDLVFPAGTTTADTFARFRLFPAGDTVAPTGAATGGEVEDYAVTVQERELRVEKTSDATSATRQGDVVTYTVTATNIGTGDYTAAHPAVVLDDMGGVLDDGAYNDDAQASDGPAPTFAAPLLSWSGPLAAGETVTITYTVTLAAGGDGVVRNVAFTPDCVPGDPDCDPVTPECDPPVDGIDPDTGLPCAPVEFLLPRLTHTKVADTTELPTDGGEVEYTITVTNQGPGVFTDAAPGRVTDDLSEVLDDGTVTVAPSADIGTATFDPADGTIVWEGPLGVGEVATFTYTVTYDSSTGDNVLRNVACLPAALAQDPTDPCRSVVIPGSALQERKTSDPASGTSVVAGQEVTYTLHFENTGEAAATVDTFDDLSDVLDDATLTAGPTPSDAAITATLDGTRLDIDGTVPAGETYTVTYTVTVNPFAQQGDHILANVLGEDCLPDDLTCRTEHPIPHLSVEKTSDADSDVDTGDVVTYTVTVRNDGEGDYTEQRPGVAEDDLAAVLDDATYNGDATASAGEVSYASPVLTWTGALAAGDTETFTYSVTVTNAGDHVLENVAGAVCDSPEICDPPVVIVTPLPHVVPGKSSDPVSGEALGAGDVVTYTLSWTNDGEAPGRIGGTDDLSGVLDDADITSEPVSSDPAVTVVRNGDALRVTGPIQVDQTVTVTYQVTVKPDGQRGDNIAKNLLASDVPPHVCEDADSDCEPVVPPTTEHPIRELDDWKTVDPASGATVQPGQEVTYTLHFENTGEADVAVDREDVLTRVLDDAAITAEPTSSDPALTVSPVDGDRFAVTGTLAPDQHVTVTYTVTVDPDGQRGDDRLANALVPAGADPAEECAPVDPERPDCTVNHVSNVIASKSSDPESGTEVAQGRQVTYTLTFENVSANPDAAPAPIDYTDHMVDVLDDATLTAEPVASDAGLTAVVDGDVIRITGGVAAGATATVSYTVTVKAYDEQGDHHLGNVVAVTGEDPTCAPGSGLCTEHELVAPAPPLLPTGGTIAWLAVLGGLLLLLAGGGAILLSRRRNAAAEEEYPATAG
jgi:uncharacterized repeat protein (TIGR01451 family)